MNKATRIGKLDRQTQATIIQLLKQNGCMEEDIELAMSGRLIDLNGTLDMEDILGLC